MNQKQKKPEGRTNARGNSKRFHWWYILIGVVLVIGIAAGSLYFYVNGRLQQKSRYSDSWKQAQSAASDVSSQADDGALDSVDAGDFSKVQQKDYPIIKVKRKDPNVENILLMGIDGGTVGGVGVNRADSLIVASFNTRTNT